MAKCYTDSLLRETMLPLVLNSAGEEGMEMTEGVGECWLSCGAAGSLTEGWSIPLIDFFKACLAFCRGFPEEVKRLANEATLPKRFFRLLGPSSSPKLRECVLTLSA